MRCCVYAFTSASVPAVRLRGMRGEPLTVVRRGTLAAIVGELRSAPVPSPRNLRAYHEVLQRLAEELPAVLPVRFATVMPNLDELIYVLRERRRALLRSLRRVRHRAQMTVRLVARDQAPAHDGTTTDRSSGEAYLRSRAAAARRAQRRECVLLRGLVSRWVREERIEDRAGVLSVYHLVPRSVAARYRSAVTAAAWGDVTVDVGGPFPPFAFAED